jgi:hypothetical protein
MDKAALFQFMLAMEAWKEQLTASPLQSRERSMIVVKLDEARMWATEVLALLDEQGTTP